ncbi:MAG: hypothetical protein EBR82_67970 [Caulobacteraceae bacterium]|nr:hypothetical protein [Caulobacteraceae bacterium]
MNNEYPVFPNIKRIVNICKFKYNILELNLFKSIRIAVYLYNENDMLIEARQYVIENEEYDAWQNDDGYIIKLLKEKIQKEFNPNL